MLEQGSPWRLVLQSLVGVKRGFIVLDVGIRLLCADNDLYTLLSSVSSGNLRLSLQRSFIKEGGIHYMHLSHL